MLQQVDGVEKPADLVAAQYDGEPLRLAAGRNHIVDAPLPLERDLVEEADRGDGNEHGTGRKLPVLAQMDLVGPDIVGAQQLGRLAEMTGELGDLLQIRALGERREVADLHILDHATAKRGHGLLLCGMRRAREGAIHGLAIGAVRETARILAQNRAAYFTRLGHRCLHRCSRLKQTD